MNLTMAIVAVLVIVRDGAFQIELGFKDGRSLLRTVDYKNKNIHESSLCNQSMKHLMGPLIETAVVWHRYEKNIRAIVP